MRKFTLTVVLLFCLIFSGCSNTHPTVQSMTEQEVKQLVIDYHTSGVGDVKVVTITPESDQGIVTWDRADKFIVTWENTENCQEGTTVIYKNGDIENIKESIC